MSAVPTEPCRLIIGSYKTPSECSSSLQAATAERETAGGQAMSSGHDRSVVSGEQHLLNYCENLMPVSRPCPALSPPSPSQSAERRGAGEGAQISPSSLQ